VVKAKFTANSKDGGKSIEAKQFKTILKECGQEPAQHEIENVEKEPQFKGKANFTMEETLLAVQMVWQDNVYNSFNLKI
jgi:Ca2+-binding EF-hand superfamily protein